MSNEPPSDPPQPYHPPQPYGPPHPYDATQVSGESSVPYPTQPLPGGGEPAWPAYRPGYASLPTPGTDPEPYPPTAQFPGQPSYGPPRQPPYEPGQAGPAPAPPPRRSNAPLIAVILAVTVLLCGGAVTAGALAVNNVVDRAEEAVEPITDPTVPDVPTELPGLPTDLPGLPTGLPGLPTDLPTGLPGLPGSGKKITVVYEVTGDGPAEIVYTEKIGDSPERVSNAELPWKRKTTMEGAALVSVTAVRSSTGSGTISCRVTVDGEEVARRTGEGTLATASCMKLILN